MTSPETENPRRDLPAPRECRGAALAHASALLAFFLPLGNLAGPGLIWWTVGKRSPFVACHSAQAFFFQAMVATIAWALFIAGEQHGFGSGPHMIALVAGMVPPVPGFVQALRGRSFRYPLTGRLTP